MKFQALLFGLFILLKTSSKISPAFRKRLKERDLSMTIKTADGRNSRSYAFSNGSVSSNRGGLAQPDFSMIWSNAEVGAATMIKAKNGPSPIMKAVNNGDLKLEGDAAALTWFVMTLDKLKDIYLKK